MFRVQYRGSVDRGKIPGRKRAEQAGKDLKDIAVSPVLEVFEVFEVFSRR